MLSTSIITVKLIRTILLCSDLTYRNFLIAVKSLFFCKAFFETTIHKTFLTESIVKQYKITQIGLLG